MNTVQPYAEAIALKNDKILKVGKNEAIDRLIGNNTKVINLNGRVVVPGFIDTHVHLADYGRLLAWVDLKAVTSIEEIKKRVGQRVQKVPNGRWILGRGWNDANLAETRFPTLLDLDDVSPDNPVVLYHQCGRLCVVNSVALKQAGVTRKTKSPLGGKIEKDKETRFLTGVLQGNATDLVWKKIPEPCEEEVLEGARSASEKLVETGITSVHWIICSLTELKSIQRLHAQDELPLRIYLVIPVSLLDDALSLGIQKKFNNNMFRIGGFEIFVDGSLSAKTASLIEPYTDEPANEGQLLHTQKETVAFMNKMKKTTFQIVIHAMGDRALDVALNAIEETSKGSPINKDRIRLEQAAVFNIDLIERTRKHGLIVSVQPPVIESEFSMWSAIDRLNPKRARWLYPLKTLTKKGILVVGGSDCPMEPESPLFGIQATVMRESFPEERLTPKEALRLYTVNAAYSSFEENLKGSISPGKLADLTVLSHDPLKVPHNKIQDIEVEMTIVGGKITHSKIYHP